MKEEIWRPIPEYETFYEASNLGRIRRTKSGGRARLGHILTGCPDACGYLRMRLCRSAADQVTHKVHRLVLSAFIGKRGPEWTVNHKNGVRHDNRLENLEYLSHADNIRHSAMSYSKLGSDNPRATFTEAQVIEIRKLHAEGMKQSAIARRFKSNKYTINDIIHRRSWSHI